MSHDDGFFHYLPVTDAAMKWGFYLTGAGRGHIGAGQDYPRLGHPRLYDFRWNRGRTLPEFQLILVTEGHGVFESHETGEMEIGSDSLIILFPGVWHRYCPDRRSGWMERWISFNGEISRRLTSLALIQPREAVQSVQNVARLIHTFDDLLDRIHANPAQNSILLSMRGMGLLASAIEKASGAADRGETPDAPWRHAVDDPIVLEAMKLIWTHSHRPLSVEQIARKVSVTRRTLDRHFRAAVGRTPLEEIHNCRMSRAKRMLSETDLPVKIVAYQAGFPSEERMRVAFLQSEELPPLKYRLRAARAVKNLSGRPKKARIGERGEGSGKRGE